MSFHRVNRLVLATLGLLSVPCLAAADPPGRVARLSFTGGSVSFRPGTLDQWTAATLNYPLTIGDHLWTDRNARAEMQLGRSVTRIGPYTELSILNLDDRTAQIRLTQGTLSVRVRALDRNEAFEVDTPNGAVSLLAPGLYRIDVDESGQSSTATVRNGEAEVVASQLTRVRVQESLTLTGLDAPQAVIARAVRIDGFEDWCLARDRRAENVQAGRYVSRAMIGYEDLDPYGTWQVEAEHGPVWVPRVAAGWVPYRYGHWVWVEPWGWTWIDDAPWGFAPFHYGRWVRLRPGWAWVPGAVIARPVYAPALVAFVGGSGWRVSAGVGAVPVAWFPLGPREVFVPVYRVSPVYVQQINVAHVTNINVTNINVTNTTYVNRTVTGAVTAVPRDAFVRGRPVAHTIVAVRAEELQQASVVGTAAPVAPQPVSVVGEAPRRAGAPPASVVNRQVVARTAPPPPPVPLAGKQGALERQPGRPLDEAVQPQTPDPHPLVRRMAGDRAPERVVSPGSVAVPSSAQPTAAQAPAPRVQPTSDGAAAATRDNTTDRRRNAQQPPAQPSQSSQGQPSAAGDRQPASPRGATPSPPPAAPASERSTRVSGPELAAQHARERAEMDGRQAAERARLQAQHRQQEQRARDAQERAQMRQQHEQEDKTVQQRHRAERDDQQRRQDEQRKRQRDDRNERGNGDKK